MPELPLFKSKIRKSLFKLYFAEPNKKYYIRQLAKNLNLPIGNLYKELEYLEDLGILKSRRVANLKYYFLNKKNPIYSELKSITEKTLMLKENIKNEKIPSYFKPILWSYNFKKINPNKDKKIIIIQAINYGDLKHLKYIKTTYGVEEIRRVLKNVLKTEIRKRARRLIKILFNINEYKNAPRSIG